MLEKNQRQRKKPREDQGAYTLLLKAQMLTYLQRSK